MTLKLPEIAIAFKNCNGDSKLSFKEHLKTLYKQKEDFDAGFIIIECNNYILTDIKKLLSKAILNICSTDYLIKKGYLSWGFVTSYYANFFLVQALNRTQLKFNTWVISSIDVSYKNYSSGSIFIKSANRSTDEHQKQFSRFFENFKDFSSNKGIDRYWNIGLRPFELGNEAEIRNTINYELTNEHFNGLGSTTGNTFGKKLGLKIRSLMP